MYTLQINTCKTAYKVAAKMKAFIALIDIITSIIVVCLHVKLKICVCWFRYQLALYIAYLSKT